MKLTAYLLVVYRLFQAGEKSSLFIDYWLETYNLYDETKWGENSVVMAHRLAQIFPHLVHVEKTSFNHPTFQRIGELYLKNYNISANFAIHLYFKLMHYIPESLQELDGYNCTVGLAMRRVLYGTEHLRTQNNITVGKRLNGKAWVQEKLKLKSGK